MRLDTKNDGTFRWKNKLINHTKNYEFPSKQKKSIAKFHKIFLSNQKNCNEDQHGKHCMLISRNIWFNRLKSPGNYFYSGFSLVAKMRLPWLQMPSMMLGLLVSSVLVARFAGLTLGEALSLGIHMLLSQRCSSICFNSTSCSITTSIASRYLLACQAASLPASKANLPVSQGQTPLAGRHRLVCFLVEVSLGDRQTNGWNLRLWQGKFQQQKIN